MKTSHTAPTAVLSAVLLAAVLAPDMPIAQAQGATGKVLVAHRGASAYAPEHTAAAYRLAIEQGADYVEPDLAITRDGVFIALHDATLERTTNVVEVFPDRFVTDAKGQKRWFAVDFTLEEIKRLDAGSWFDPKFAGERVLTWDEAVAIVGRRAGLYPELKAPELYRSRGIDVVAAFVETLTRGRFDATTPIRGHAPLVIQSFDEPTVRRLARLVPAVPRTMLIGSEAMAEKWLSSADRVRELATFATDLGAAKGLIARSPNVVRWAQAVGMTVTPYTFRSADTGAFPDVTAEMEHFLYTLGVDAVFTDNPDLFPRR